MLALGYALTSEGSLVAIIPQDAYTDDMISLNTQVSTQYDGLRHYPYSDFENVSTYQWVHIFNASWDDHIMLNRYYNDLITFEDIVSPTRVKTLGIQSMQSDHLATSQ